MTIFRPDLLEKVLSGVKTQTRRLVKPGDRFVMDEDDGQHMVVRGTQNRLRYRVGHVYSIQPGRGRAAVARFKLLDLDREDARDISTEDAMAEGFRSIEEFLETWVHFYDAGDVRMWQNPGMFADVIEWVGSKGQTLNSEAHHLPQWLIDNRPDALYDAWVLKFELIEVNNGQL